METLLERPLPGGPLAIDLINTRWRVDGSTIDWLDTDAAVLAFSEQHGRAIDESQVAAARAHLTRARLLAQQFLEGSANGYPAELVDDINEMLEPARIKLADAEANPILTVTTGDRTKALGIEALANAIETLDQHQGRVRSCEHDDCILWFLDTSKGGRRRWCSMQSCGNRAKAKRHYDRNAPNAGGRQDGL